MTAEERLRRFMAEADYPPDPVEAGNLVRDALNEVRRAERLAVLDRIWNLVPGWYVNGSLTNKAQIEQLQQRINRVADDMEAGR